MTPDKAQPALYRAIWRWHFYAGLLVIPFILLLSVTGGIYLFKPQVERWEERDFRGLPAIGGVAPSARRDAALLAYPGARFLSYRLPERTGDAALVLLALPGGGDTTREVFVSPSGKVLGALDPDRRIMEIVKDIHGQLLAGHRGSWLVELAASWAIVLIATGLYLWWPKDTRLAGVLWPRWRRGGRVLLRDLHAVTGFWVAGLAMILLLTGLPWADVWGSGFKAVREEMGWVNGRQDWTIGGRPANAGDHAMHGGSAPATRPGQQTGAGHAGSAHAMALPPAPAPDAVLDRLVAQAQAARLPFPVIVTPSAARAPAWTVRSDSQNRPLRVTIVYDPEGVRELSRETFAEKHVIDRIVGYGVAWHEGQLFGWINQLVGVLTALALVTLAVTGFLGWLQRKPAGKLGAPPKPSVRPAGAGIKLMMAAFLALLPMFAISVALLWLFDRIALPRLPALGRWLGMPATSQIHPSPAMETTP